MAATTRATYLRRRAVAALVLGALTTASVVVGARLLEDDREAAPPPAVQRGVAPGVPRPATDLAAIAARADVPVLCYHQIRPLTAADAAADRVYVVPPRTLDAQLARLREAGYTSVSAQDVAAHMAEGKALPPKPVLITFDDASAGQYTRALPILRRHGFTATFFVMTVVLGRPGWLTREQVRELDRSGMEIGAHTWDHQAVPGYADRDWSVQITEPKAELEQIVGHRVRAFAYPFGAWDPAAFEHLRAAGFAIAFQLADELDPDAPMLTVRRVLVGPDLRGAALLRKLEEAF